MCIWSGAVTEVFVCGMPVALSIELTIRFILGQKSDAEPM